MAQLYYATEGTNGTAFTQDDNNLEMADTVNGLAQKNARTWQVIALVSLSSFFVSLGVLVYAVTLPKTVPVVVTVNPEGQAAYVGKIDKSSYNATGIPDSAKEYQIRRLVSRMFQWVIDRDAQQGYVIEALSLVQGSAARELDLFFRANNPFSVLGEKTRSLTIEPPLKQTDKTWIVYFTTSEKNRSGIETRKTRWSALINLDLYDPSPENPLGIYITNFDIKPIEEKNQ
jgi:type IV secretion system protein VirB5